MEVLQETYFDNFFTSPRLMRSLTGNSLYGIGVVRFNRKLLPKVEPKSKQKEAKAKEEALKGKKLPAKTKKAIELVHGEKFGNEENLSRGDSDYLISKDGLVALRWFDSKVVMLLTNCMDPSKLVNVERRQKGSSEKLKLPCQAIIKDYNGHMNGEDIHDQLKTAYEIDRKSKFRYYLRIFFDLMDSCVVNAHVIYKMKINSEVNLFKFKVMLAESLINGFTSRKRKFAADEPQLAAELPLSIKQPDHIIHFTEKRQRCVYCFNDGRKDVKCSGYCKTCNVHLCVQKNRNCFNMYHSS